MLRQRLVRWLLFGVVISLVPLAFRATIIWFEGAVPSLFMIIGNGELLLIAVGICSWALGDIIGVSTRSHFLEILLGAMSVIIILYAAFCFAHLTSLSPNINPVDEGRVVVVSIATFSAALAVSGCCVAIRQL